MARAMTELWLGTVGSGLCWEGSKAVVSPGAPKSGWWMAEDLFEKQAVR